MNAQNDGTRSEDGRAETDLAVSLIGVTEGLEVCTFASGDLTLPPDAWIEVSAAEASLSADHGVYVIRRECQGGRMTTWIGTYRHAREMDRDRAGNYYGAGLWLIGSAAHTRGADILVVLEALRRDLQAWALTEGRFTRRLAELRQRPLVGLHRVANPLQRIYASLEPAPSSGQRVMPTATASVDATAYGDAAQGAAQLLIEWALQGTALFGAYSRVVLHTHPQTFSAVHRASLQNLVLPRQLGGLNSFTQPAMLGRPVATGVSSPWARASLRRRRNVGRPLSAKVGPSPQSDPAQAIIAEEQPLRWHAPRAPRLANEVPGPVSPRRRRSAKTPLSDRWFGLIVISLVMSFLWLVHHAVTM